MTEQSEQSCLGKSEGEHHARFEVKREDERRPESVRYSDGMIMLGYHTPGSVVDLSGGRDRGLSPSGDSIEALCDTTNPVNMIFFSARNPNQPDEIETYVLRGLTLADLKGSGSVDLEEFVPTVTVGESSPLLAAFGAGEVTAVAVPYKLDQNGQSTVDHQLSDISPYGAGKAVLARAEAYKKSLQK